MAKTELEKYRSFVSQQLKRLSSILQQYTRGDFSKTIPIPEEENEFTEFLKVLNQLGKNLGDCMQEKEQNQDKTNQLQRRIKHLNNTLLAIRRINQFIVKEKNRNVLMQKVCDLLVESLGYKNAWIALFDQSGNYRHAAEAGLDKHFAPMKKMLETEDLPECAKAVLAKRSLITIKNPRKECKNCPLSTSYAKNGALISPIIHDQRVYGVIATSIPQSLLTDASGKELFHEVSENIAFALHDIESNEKSRQTEQNLKESEAKYRQLFTTLNEGIWRIDENANTTFVNPQMAKMLGYTEQEMHGKHLFYFMDDEGIYAAKKKLKIRRQGIQELHEFIFRKKNGQPVYSLVNTSPIIDQEGNYCGALASVTDITGRKQTEQALKESEAKFREIFNSTSEAIVIHDDETGKILDCNDVTLEMYGYETKDELLSGIVRDYSADQNGFGQKEISNHIAQARREGHHTFEWLAKKKSGDEFWVEVSLKRTRIGGEGRILAVARDISERKQNEAALKTSEEFNRSIIENSKDCIKILDRHGNLSFMSKSGKQLLEIENIDSYRNKPWLDFWEGEHQKNARQAIECAKNGKVGYFEGFCPTRKGTPKWWGVQISPIYDSAGAINKLLAVSRDITAQKELEEKLLHSQKMEAIGRLAGGVAHDFNNLLTVINGYCAILMTETNREGEQFEPLKEIKRAGQRAASLTRQLLAFSRKQILEPKVIDLNALVTNLEKMLGRLIGEDIELQTYLPSHLARIKADPAQIEQIIINLAVNARDAMPRGGKLTIETSNRILDENYAKTHHDAKPGNYVLITISDNGTGMDKTTLNHIFEPFFTTKETGKGTGLGLATVYGIVKQSGGNIWVYSEPNKGTVFKIYLPAIEDIAETLKAGTPRADTLNGTETILVVEDETNVLNFVKRALEKHGYQLITALSGTDAIKQAQNIKQPIHLILTDVIMPVMSGKDLALEIKKIHPETKVCFMSGYTDNAIVHHGVLDEGTHFIQKPFSAYSLAKKLRTVLDEKKK